MASADVDFNSMPYWQDHSARNPTNATSRAQANQPADDLDDILNHDLDINNTSRSANAEASNIPARVTERTNTNDDGLGLGLGIDEEIKIRKPRAPIAKLDEERLLSAKGIPKLRRIAKDRFKFKGKGHEFTDVSRLLNNYQLWLDDLFPKARFADGVAIIEKLGHKKRLQVMRKEWIDEGKPKPVVQDEVEEDRDSSARESNDAADRERNVSRAATRNQEVGRQDVVDMNDDDMDEDIYAEPTPPVDDLDRQKNVLSARSNAHAEEPDLDELDALLAEDAAAAVNHSGRGIHATQQSTARDNFADDEEAMAAMEDVW